MQPASPIVRFLGILCIVLMLGLQVLGVTAGFVCKCIDQLLVSNVSHCHSEPGGDCHAGEDSDQEAPANDECPDHLALNSKVTFNSVGSVGAPAAVPALVALLPMDFALSDVRGIFPKPNLVADSESPPAPGVLISNTLVLRI